jgi:hypothetical protein
MLRLMIRQTCLLLLCVIAGCASTPEETAAPPADMQALPVCGTWTDLGAGLRMRICADRTISEETGIIRAALVVQNTTKAPVSIKAADTKNSLCVWGVDDMLMGESMPGRELPLAAGQTWVSPMTEVGIPPGASHRLIRAQLDASTGMASATVPITVTPAAWGEPSGGLRLRVGTDRAKYAAGDKTVVRLFLHNTTDKPITVHPLDQASREQGSHQDRLSLSFNTLDEMVREVPPGGFIAARLDEPLLLAPGRYRLRATVAPKELSAAHVPAWFGSVTSNEVEFVVE